jgi:ubiquinone/menaquinone biosynthesis C-methylase UbiE
MKNTEVKAYYEKEAHDYTEEFYEKRNSYPTLIYRQNYILKMIREIKLPKASKILDIGCGPGELLLELKNEFEFMVGVDIAQEMINIAYGKLENISTKNKILFEVGDIENLRFDDHSFDVIICSGVIEYLKDDEAWLKEIIRTLKPGGYLIINVTNKYSIRKWTSGLIEKLKSSDTLLNLMNFIKEKILGKGKIHHFPFTPRLHSPIKFDAFLVEHGFKKVNHNYFDFAVLPAPFDTLFGFVTTPIKKYLERFTRTNMLLNGTGYIVLAKKI